MVAGIIGEQNCEISPIRTICVQGVSQMLHEDRERAGIGVVCRESVPDIAFVIECQQHRNPKHLPFSGGTKSFASLTPAKSGEFTAVDPGFVHRNNGLVCLE